MEPPSPAELTFICIDNSERLLWLTHRFNDQLDAIELYCTTVFECNPNNKVCLYSMGSLESRILVHPTSDLQKILRCLQDLRCQCESDTNFTTAFSIACTTLSRSDPNMKRRLLMFVGSCIDLHPRLSTVFGMKLKERGVALNVINFFLLKRDTSLDGISMFSDYHYGREELGTLVTTAGNNSQIVDVEKESSILDILSKFMLENNLHYLEKKAAADNEYVEAPGIQAPRIKYGGLLKTYRIENHRDPSCPKYSNMFDIPGIKMFGPGKYLDLSIPCVRPVLRLKGHNEKNKSAADENQEKAGENVSVKQESELSCKENYKAAAQGKCIEVFDKPEIQCLSKVTPHPRRARKKKNQKKMPIFKQESELSCNEKNKSAADDEYVKLSKKTPHISGNENQEKAEENVSVKQEELELSCNEKDEAAAQGLIKVFIKLETIRDLSRIIEQFHKEKSTSAADCNDKYEAAAQGLIKVFIKPETVHDLSRIIEHFHKEKSTSAADDESVQAPEIQNVSKVTPQQRRARKKKNQKKNTNV